MKYVCFEQALEVQVGGHFYSFVPGSYNVDDDIADIIIANYHDRGARFGTLPSEDAAVEDDGLPVVEVEDEPDAVEPVSSPGFEAGSGSRRKRTG